MRDYDTQTALMIVKELDDESEMIGFATHHNDIVRQRLATNQNITRNVVEILLKQENDYPLVVSNLFRNEYAQKHIIDILGNDLLLLDCFDKIRELKSTELAQSNTKALRKESQKLYTQSMIVLYQWVKQQAVDEYDYLINLAQDALEYL